MSKDLAQLRTAIDAVDRELLRLLNQRAALAGEVGDLKRAEARWCTGPSARRR
jgi:chorismate mutase/prephenate dehydratase